MRGFEAASGLLADKIRTAGEARGFAVARLLTDWSEIVGDETARLARPVKIGYAAKDGFGATLTLLVTGPAAPRVQMELPRIRDRVNACYGYNAIARVRLTQTAPEGFGEMPAPPKPRPAPTPETCARAREVAEGVTDPTLHAALERLAQNVLSRGPKA
ncbi:DUF721 domain-containing protein [Frigidibacter sp. MR17.24]|uniref:DUF721 domain-containing protein n=1 Tax=Frigidibacter sp. MR17.24 TaxID=3127345 RepID=UPI00301311C3